MNIHPWVRDVVETIITFDHPIPRSIHLYPPTRTATTTTTTQARTHCEIGPSQDITTTRSLEQADYYAPQEEYRDYSHPWTWNVTLKDLTTRPKFHPRLQRTALVLDNIPVQTIAARISQFNKANSIECSYQTSHAKSTTPNLLKFSIHLWAGSKDQSKDDCNPFGTPSVIMEVQRLQGCSIQMHGVRRRLIQYVMTGNDTHHRSTIGRGHHVPSRLVQRTHACFGRTNTKKQEATRENDQCCTKALSLCLDLLESDKIDQNCLGMESLATISDHSRVKLADATTLARSLVYRESCPRLQGAFRDVFLRSLGETEHVGYSTACYAMKTLRNSLEILLSSKEQASGLGRPKPIDLSWSFWREITNDLVHCLKMARKCTQRAVLAARCLRLIVHLAPASLSLLPEYPDLPFLALAACDHGKAFNSSLERESSLLFESLSDLQ